MKDLIERQAIINKLKPWLRISGYSEGELNMLNAILYELKNMPSAQPDLNEWCTDCKEYDKEKHSCPRFNRVIREALNDAQPKIIDFDLAEKMNKAYDDGYETGYLQCMHDWGNVDE